MFSSGTTTEKPVSGLPGECQQSTSPISDDSNPVRGSGEGKILCTVTWLDYCHYKYAHCADDTQLLTSVQLINTYGGSKGSALDLEVGLGLEVCQSSSAVTAENVVIGSNSQINVHHYHNTSQYLEPL